jgi:hypothetical protein
MGQKKMVLALAVVSAALFAMPAVASAQSWHLDQTSLFSVAGSGGTLTSTVSITCSATTGSGNFSTTTEGTVTLLFSGCKEAFNLPCTTSGQASGVIKTTARFDAIMFSPLRPALLLTPDLSNEVTPKLKEFNNFVCLGLTVRVFGAGVIGTITAPECGKASTNYTVVFASSSAGEQADLLYTGTRFDLSSNISQTSHPTASLDGTATITFPAARTMTCT